MIILYALILLFVLFICLLAAPIDFSFSLDTRRENKAVLRISWLWGLVRSDESKTVAKKPVALPVGKKIKAKRKPPGEAKRGSKFLFAMLGSKGFVRRIILFVIDCARAMKVGPTTIFLRYGFDSPADTGRMVGVIAPLVVYLQGREWIHVDVAPAFHDATFVFIGKSNIRIFPIQYVWLFTKLLVSVEIWRAIGAGIKASR